MRNMKVDTTKYDDLSREELIKRLEKLEREKVSSQKYKEQEDLLNKDRAQEKLAILKAAVNIGDSLIWEYDVKQDTIHVDYDLSAYNGKAPSRLKIEPFKKKEDFLYTIHPDDRQEVYYNHFLPLLRGEINSYSIQYRRLFNDQILWVEANVQPYQYDADGAPSHVVYYLSDITEQKLLQDKLYEVENKYRKIIKAIPDAIMVLTKDANVQNVYTHVNENLFNVAKRQIGRTIDQLFPFDIASSLKNAIEQVVQTQREVACNFAVHDKGIERFYYSRVIPFEEDSVLVMSRDVSEYMQNKLELDYVNELLRTILSNIPVILLVKKINDDFKFVYFNNAAEKFTGVSSQFTLGKTDFDIFPNQQWAQYIRETDLAAVEQGHSFEYAVNYQTPFEESRIVNVIRLVIDNMKYDHSPLLVTMVWDITQERKNEIELLKVKEADKLKSAFLANMSHEIRTPLNAIVGFSDVLSEVDDPVERSEYLDIIHKNNELLLRLIDDILDFSKIESNMLVLNYKNVDFKNICIDLYYVHSLKMKQNVKMYFDFELPSVILYTDEKRLTQVISNLLNNAIKFTDTGSITLSYEIGEKHVYVSVKDTGIGISKQEKSTIFNRFVKLNNYSQGTGLGLTISKMIIERLGGKIEVDSELDKGSVFRLTLPLK